MNIALLYTGEEMSNVQKYVMYTPDSFSSYQEALGITFTPEPSNIESIFGVPTVGMVEVKITITTRKTFLQEIINVDTTSSTSFWEDIKGWLFSQNSYDIETDDTVGPTFGWWKILNPKNNALIILETPII